MPVRFRFPRSNRSALLALPPLLTLASLAWGQNPIPPVPKPRQLQLKQVHALDTRPEDLTITPNQLLAFVRCDDSGLDLVKAYALGSGNEIPIGGAAALGAHRTISDAVQATDSRAVVIGSGPNLSEGTTYVDIFAIAYGPIAITNLANYSFADGGFASDVAITPDGTKAVVTSQGRIRVFDLGTGSLLTTLNVVGSPRWSFVDGLGNPWVDQAADSVVVTNERAVVQFTKTACSLSLPEPVVYVVDLLSTSTTPLLSENFESYVSGCSTRWAHDLALSPNGTRALSGARSVTGLFRIYRVPVLLDKQVDFTPGAGAGGLFSVNSQTTAAGFPLGTVVDSVLLSDTRAVAINDRVYLSVYDITGDALTQVPPFPKDLRPPSQGGAPGVEDGVHDLAMSEDGLRVVIKSERRNYVLTNIESPTPPINVEYWANPGNSSPRGSANVWVSDSVVVTGNRAVSISTDPALLSGYVQFITMDSSPGCVDCSALTSTATIALNSSDDRLADLALAPNKQHVFVRGSDSLNDLLGFEVATGASITPAAGIDLSGHCRAVDQIEATDTRVITISEDPNTSSGFVYIYSY